MTQTRLRRSIGLLSISLVIASAARGDEFNAKGNYQGVELAEDISEVERNSPPFISEEEWRGMPSVEQEFKFGYKNIHGLKVPVINGDGLIGTTYHFSSLPEKQHEWDAKIYRAQGMNWVRASYSSNPPLGQDPVDINLWNKKAAIWQNNGIGFFVSYFAMHQLQSIVKSFSKEKDFSINSDFKKHKSAGHKYDRVGDFFNPAYVKAATEMFLRLCDGMAPEDNMIALHPFDEPSLVKIGPFSPAAEKHFQNFTKDLFKDISPAMDSNNDGTTFNSAYGTTYKTWKDVKVFKHNCADPKLLTKRARLDYIWKKLGFIEFLNEMAKAVKEKYPEKFWVHSYLDSNWCSVLASQPAIDVIATGNYSNYAKSGKFAAAAHTFGKTSIASHINTYKGNYYGVRQIVVGSLPYYNGMIFWPLSHFHSDKIRADYGSNYNLVNWWTFNNPITDTGNMHKWGGKLQKVVEYDSKFLNIPQVAPFINKFSSVPEEKANGVLWLETPNDYLIKNNLFATEVALVFGGTTLDLNKNKVIIFQPKETGPVSRETHSQLEEYVSNGGVVVIDAVAAGQGFSLRGTANKNIWLKDFEFARRKPELGSLVYSDDFNDSVKFNKHLFSKKGNPVFDNGVLSYRKEDVEFILKFDIPESAAGIYIQDKHRAWASPDESLVLFISKDAKSWHQLYDEQTPWTSPTFNKVVSLKKSGEKKTVYLKYVMKSDLPVTTIRNNHGGACLHRLQINTLDKAQLLSFQEFEDSPWTECRIQKQKVKFPFIGEYLMPRSDANLEAIGETVDSTGKTYPLAFIKKSGKGKWILVNSPGLFQFHKQGMGKRDIDWKNWNGRFNILNSIVKQCAGTELGNYLEIFTSQGDNCLLAVKPNELTGDFSKYQITANATHKQTVVFDTYAKRIVGGAFVEAKEGKIKFKTDLSGTFATKIWTLKPYGKPTMLYADGTYKHKARIDDGEYIVSTKKTTGFWNRIASRFTAQKMDKELMLTFAETAYVSSPKRPKQITTKTGDTLEYEYDDKSKLLTVHGTGSLQHTIINY